IHLVLTRREQDIDAAPLELRPIGIQRARIAIEVFVRPELKSIDEDAGDDAIPMAARNVDERQVTRVQIAHRGNEGDALGLCEAIAKLIGWLNDDHAVSPVVSRSQD